MRKHIILLLLLCLHIAARGQTPGNLDDIDLSVLPKATQPKTLRYWFDNDGDVQTISQLSSSQSLDVSQLIDGMHTLHCQIIDTEGSVAYVKSCVFLKVNSQSGATQPKSLNYWFDDETTIKDVDIAGGAQLLDASGLSEGLHTLHYQVLCNNGQITPAKSSIFLRLNADSETTVAKSLRYWFDDDGDNVQTVSQLSGSQSLDVSQLIEGMHTLHCQVIDTEGRVAYVKSCVFLKFDSKSGAIQAKSLSYWFDDETTIKNVDIAGGAQLLDASELTEGLHTLHYQVLCNNGQMTPAKSSIFLRFNDNSETTVAKSLRYWFDDDASTMKVTAAAKGTQTLDVSVLPTGLHSLNYQLIDDSGKVGAPVTRVFMKDFRTVAAGENHVTKYQYWLNTNSQTIQTVTLTSAANPYTQTALLSMQKEPIHSDCFMFEVTNGVPTVYAKNIFHIRFHDAQGYFMDGEKAFVDYSVKQEVTDITLLESGVRATTEKPAENAIKWYKVSAVKGDSLQFKLDRAATIQLFSPSGKEVYSASGAESVNWGGCHAEEDGTFYVALHDVTATYGNDISIDYEHIDKYAVLRQDVNVVGNGGFTTITFEGNGFLYLNQITLTNETDTVLKHHEIEYLSDSQIRVWFDFSDITEGMYNISFDFNNEETRIVPNAIRVETAKDIELVTQVSYPTQFLSGTTATFTYEITNKGNMTAYGVPIYLQLTSTKRNDIKKIKLNGPDHIDYVNDIPDLSDDEISSVRQMHDTSGDDMYLYLKESEDEKGNHTTTRSGYFFIEIPPNGTKKVDVGVTSTGDVDVELTVPNESPSLTSSKSSVSQSGHQRTLRDQYCCVRDRIECALGVVSDLSGLIGNFLPSGTPIASILSVTNCATDILKNISENLGYYLCRDYDGNENLSVQAETYNRFMHGANLASSILRCAAPDLRNPAQQIIEDSRTLVHDFVECKDAFSTMDDKCLPSQTKGGSAHPVTSFDPNDIYGYTAESGSKAIRDELTDVYYTIQFENDTAFATASAHDIYVTDTLDNSKFDLSTFKPTRVKIGEKLAELTGDKNFVTTIDMRPEINAIAQVEGTFDENRGIAKWHISSLDPMSMEPTDNPMDGVLPVNFNGNGIGEVSYNIKLKPDLVHGTEINNRAGILFDQNDIILTPTWTNIVDAVPPTSSVEYTSTEKTDTVTLHFAGEDERSGVWRYTIYAQDGKNAPWREVGLTDSSAFDFAYAEGIDYGFCVLATDSAGNVEQKELAREAELRTFIDGDANSDGVVDTKDAVLVISYYLGLPGTYLNMSAADIVEDGVIDTKDAVAIIDKYLNTSTGPKAIKNRKRIRVL